MLLPLLQNNLQETGAAIAAITGTASSGLTEAQIVAGGETIIVTLTNDTWVAAGATFDAQRQNIIDGLDSAQSEVTGWNNEVRDNEVVTAVVRTSDTVVTITLSAAASYDVTADETITVTVPATALVTSSGDLTGSPTLSVTADAEPSRAKGGRSRKPKRYVVEIDGQFFPADNIAAVQAVLGEAETVAMESAARDAKGAPEAIRIKPPKIRVRTGSGQETTSVTLQRDVQRTQQRVNAIYRKAQAHVEELRRAIRVREGREEEEAIISLLL